jgi:hypothetical protein
VLRGEIANGRLFGGARTPTGCSAATATTASMAGRARRTPVTVAPAAPPGIDNCEQVA